MARYGASWEKDRSGPQPSVIASVGFLGLRPRLVSDAPLALLCAAMRVTFENVSPLGANGAPSPLIAVAAPLSAQQLPAPQTAGGPGILCKLDAIRRSSW